MLKLEDSGHSCSSAAHFPIFCFTTGGRPRGLLGRSGGGLRGRLRGWRWGRWPLELGQNQGIQS